MPPVEVDVQRIPDIIEAQLTLSYSRLADLIRVIVDQGNYHDAEIDNLKRSMERLTHENTELKQRVLQLQGKQQDKVEEHALLEKVQKDVAALTQTVEDNSLQVSKVAREAAEARLSFSVRVDESASEVRKGQKEMEEQIAASVAQIASELRTCKAFIDLWSPSDATCRSLTEEGAAGVAESASAASERCVDYLHSLPPFLRVYAELEVVKRMMLQQANDNTATRVASQEQRETLRRISQSSAFAAPLHPPGVDYGAAIEDLHQRLDNLQRSLPAGADAKGSDLTGRVQVLELRLQQLGSGSGPNPMPNEGQRRDGSAAGASVELVLRGVESRLRALEEVVEGVSASSPKPPSHPLPSEHHGQLWSGTPSTPLHHPNAAALRQRVAAMDPESRRKSANVLALDDGLRLRVAQTEESVATLQEFKADRAELTNLQKMLSNLIASASERGDSGRSLPQTFTAPRPPSARSENYHSQRMDATRVEEPRQHSRPGSCRQSWSSVGSNRPLFVGSSSVFLRDATGTLTSATVAPSDNE